MMKSYMQKANRRIVMGC